MVVANIAQRHRVGSDSSTKGIETREDDDDEEEVEKRNSKKKNETIENKKA